MFMLLSPESSRLGYALKQTQDTSVSGCVVVISVAVFHKSLQLLWSQYGVRSLAKNDYFYHKVELIINHDKSMFYSTVLV